MQRLTRKRYKALPPAETIELVFATIKKSLGLDLCVETFEKVVGQFYSCRMTLQNGWIEEFNIGVNGKGMSQEYALASACGEIMERIQNRAILRQHIVSKPPPGYLNPHLSVVRGIGIPPAHLALNPHPPPSPVMLGDPATAAAAAAGALITTPQLPLLPPISSSTSPLSSSILRLLISCCFLLSVLLAPHFPLFCSFTTSCFFLSSSMSSHLFYPLLLTFPFSLSSSLRTFSSSTLLVFLLLSFLPLSPPPQCQYSYPVETLSDLQHVRSVFSDLRLYVDFYCK